MLLFCVAAAIESARLSAYFDWYHHCRTHLSLARNSPVPHEVEPAEMGEVVSILHVGRPYQLAEVAVTRKLFATILNRIAQLVIPPPMATGRSA